MRTFVDTSALYALLDEDDDNHMAAARWFSGPGSEESEVLASHNYIIVEATALIRARLGPSATRVFHEVFVPALSIFFVDEVLHERAVAAYLASARKRTSFVDRVSFQMIRDQGLDRAFAFDRDFSSEGLSVVP